MEDGGSGGALAGCHPPPPSHCEEMELPNRILRDGINSSARINALSPGAEILYRRLMSVVDDFGRFHASPVTVRGACWPTCPEKVNHSEVVEWLQECTSGPRPLIVLYSIEGCRYLQISDFKQQTRTKSKFPGPDIKMISERQQSEIKDTSLVVVEDVVRSAYTESDVSAVAERMYALHPKKRNLVLVLPALESQASKGVSLSTVESCHAEWCATEDWQKSSGRFAPKLDEWISDRGFTVHPNGNHQKVDNTPVYYDGEYLSPAEVAARKVKK